MTEFLNPLSKEIFEKTYSHQEESIEGMFQRVALALADVEKDKKLKGIYYEKFHRLLQNFKFVPGGRILSNAGTGYKNTTMINCYVSGFQGQDIDSIEGIMAELKRQALILRSEGGYGFCVDALRPRGSYVSGIGSGSPGAVKMLEMWDKQSEVITSGSGKEQTKGKKKIRKGAMMVTMSLWHPDVLEFITAKQTKGRLTRFNMSVLASDLFWDKLDKNPEDNWDFIFPDYEADKDFYKKNWTGDIENWQAMNGKVRVYGTIKVGELYDKLIQSTYNRNEPGVLNVDTINKMNNLRVIEHITATNPCGEQTLPINGSCLLGSINCTQYIKQDLSGWDLEALKRDIPTVVRMLDNVIDTSNYPLEEQKREILNKRRIGIGAMGLGSALLIMRVPYGSQQSLDLIEEWFKTVANESYKASADLAQEKGCFPMWNYDNFLQGGFSLKLDPLTHKIISEKGLRNSHLLSVQPTGNTGVTANNVSGGLEPVFLFEYTRTFGIEVWPNDLPLDFSKWEKTKEGDVDVYRYNLDGVIYKHDNDRGLTKEVLVEDYGVSFLKSKGLWDSTAKWAVNTSNLSVKNHVDVMGVVTKYLDAACSKTVNVPADYPFEDFKKLYIEAWKTGTIKGITTYRDGTMTAVLSSVKKDSFPKERPKSVDCDIHHLKINGDNWIVLVGVINNKPYEVFAFKTLEISLSKNITKGVLVKRKSFVYDLETESVVIKDLAKYFLTDEEQSFTRMISTLGLRQGVDLEYIVEQLSKAPGSVISFSKAIARTLKKYLPDSELKGVSLCDNPDCKGRIVREEGCIKCIDCGASKCD